VFKVETLIDGVICDMDSIQYKKDILNADAASNIKLSSTTISVKVAQEYFKSLMPQVERDVEDSFSETSTLEQLTGKKLVTSVSDEFTKLNDLRFDLVHLKISIDYMNAKSANPLDAKLHITDASPEIAASPRGGKKKRFHATVESSYLASLLKKNTDSTAAVTKDLGGITIDVKLFLDEVNRIVKSKKEFLKTV